MVNQAIDTAYYAACFVAGCALAIFAPELWLQLIGAITAAGSYVAWLLHSQVEDQ